MKDIQGNELNVGDKVCYLQGKNSSANLAIGNITKIYTSKKYMVDEECSVDGHAHILPSRILKLPNEF